MTGFFSVCWDKEPTEYYFFLLSKRAGDRGHRFSSQCLMLFMPFLGVELYLTVPLFLDFAANLHRNGQLANKALGGERQIAPVMETQQNKSQRRKGAMVYLLIQKERKIASFLP